MSGLELNPKTLETLGQIKEPLGLAAVALLIAAFVLSRSKNRENVRYMFVLALVVLVGALLIQLLQTWSPTSQYILTGKVFQGDATHALRAHVALSTDRRDYQGDTDSSGRYTIPIAPDDIGLSGLIAAGAVEEGYSPSEPRRITLNNPTQSENIELYPSKPQTHPTVREVKPAPRLRPGAGTSKNQLTNNPPQAVATIVAPALDPPLNAKQPGAGDDDLFNRSRTNELDLANAARGYFNQDDYNAAIRFYSQARVVETSKVWRADYPFFATAYFLNGDKRDYEKTLDEMMLAVKHGDGTFLGHKAALGILLNNLGAVRKVLPADQWLRIDNCIDEILAQRNKTVS